MIKSMTGFGKSTTEIPGKKITVEMRSLNSKSLDLNLRLSHLYKEKELEIRGELSKQIERGKLDVAIFSESTEETTPTVINKELAKKYYHQLKELSKELEPSSNANLFGLMLKMPEVLKSEKETNPLTEKEWLQVKTTLNKTIEAFQKFRTDEGKILEKEFRSRIDIIGKLLIEIVNIDSKRIKNVRTRIQKNIEVVVEKEKIDKNRFEQELIYYIEKLDITEEKLRLKTHLDYFQKTMQESSNGRKLGFISQEIGREINTIGSKANDADIQKLVVQMKDELEKIKEQVLNVL